MMAIPRPNGEFVPDWTNGESLAARALDSGELCVDGFGLPPGRSGVVATWAGADGFGAAYVLHHLPDGRWWEEIVVLARDPERGWGHHQGDGPDETDLTAQRRADCYDGWHLVAWPHAMLGVGEDGDLLQVVVGTACRHVAAVEWSVGDARVTLTPDPVTGVLVHGALAPDPDDIVLRALGPNGAAVLDAEGGQVSRTIPTRAWNVGPGGLLERLPGSAADPDRPGLAEVLGCEQHFGRGISSMTPNARAFGSGRPTTAEAALAEHLAEHPADSASRLAYGRLAELPPDDPVDIVFAGRLPDGSVHAVVTATRGGSPGRWCVTHAASCHLPRF